MAILGSVNSVNNYGFSGANYLNPYTSAKPKTNYVSNNIYDLLNLKYGVNNAKGSSLVLNPEIRQMGIGLSALTSSLKATGNQSLFNKIGASSSNSKIAAATVDNKKFDTAKNSPIELNVKQAAKAQINSGAALKATNKDIVSGTYDFSIGINGKQQKFSINVTAADNNESIQKKMAAAINSKNIGITASVEADSKNATSKLSLTSTETGNKNESGGSVFEVTDTKGSLAAKMGVTQISQNAQNAVYTVNGGEEKTSATNSIDLGNGVTATLKDAGETTLTFQRDGSGAIDKVKELVSSLNSILAEAAKGEGRGSDRLGRAITSTNKAYKSTLEKVGINVSSGGMLSVDEDKLKKAAEDGSLEKMFQSKGNYGFAYRAGHIAQNMSQTSLYIDKAPKFFNLHHCFGE